MRGGTVGDGRGGPGSGRVPVGGRAAGLPGLPGCAAPVGVGTAARRCTGSVVCCGRGGRAVRACLVTHVLLPVTVLLRRAYAAEVVGAALPARAAGEGHRWVGAGARVPAATVRGWLRVMAGRLEAARQCVCCRWPTAPGWTSRCRRRCGCPWRDLVAALGAATAAVTGRFGPVGVLGPVTAWQVAVACSAWSAPRARLARAGRRVSWQHELPLTRADG